MLADSVRDVISNSSMASSLAMYEFTSGSPEPAVFTTEVIPKGCQRPAILIEDSGGTNWGTRAREGMDAQLVVRIFGDKDRSMDVLRAIAIDLWEALNRADLDVHTSGRGYEGVVCLANAPQSIVDEEGFPGFAIIVRAIVLKR